MSAFTYWKKIEKAVVRGCRMVGTHRVSLRSASFLYEAATSISVKILEKKCQKNYFQVFDDVHINLDISQ
jgi:hypothetical protein